MSLLALANVSTPTNQIKPNGATAPSFKPFRSIKMENATEEMRELRISAQRYEWNNEFAKAGLIRQLYVELYRRFNGLPVGEYWNLS